MKTWIIRVNRPVQENVMTGALQLSQSVPRLVAQWDRDILEWSFSSTLENRQQMEQHRDMLRYHRGDKLFWFDCGINGKVTERKFIGYGDGVRTNFFLPDRWVYAPSLVMSVNYATVSAWTLTESTGLLVFTSAPALNALVHAEKYERRAKAFFVINNNRLYGVSDNFKFTDTTNIVVREFPY